MYFCIGNTRRLYPRRALREIYMVHPPLSIKIVKNSDEIYCKEGRLSGKVFRDETYVRNLESFSVQVGKTACVGGELEGELVGIERLNFAVVLLIELPVFSVSEQRPARRRHLRPDLVRPAGNELALDKRQSVPRLQHLIFCCAGLRTLLGRFRDIDAVLDGVLK